MFKLQHTYVSFEANQTIYLNLDQGNLKLV